MLKLLKPWGRIGRCTPGSQDMAWDNPQTLYCSVHQEPLYPGTGFIEERGAHNNVLNVPLAAGAGLALGWGRPLRRRGLNPGQVHPPWCFYPITIVLGIGGDSRLQFHAEHPMAIGSAEFHEALATCTRAIEAWQPDILFISAGFDAHADDDKSNTLLCDELGWIPPTSTRP